MLQDIYQPATAPLNFGPMPAVRDQIADLTARLTPTESRIDYVTSLMRPLINADPERTRNAWYAAGRLLGGLGLRTPTGDLAEGTGALAQSIIRTTARKGSAAAMQEWRNPLPRLHAAPLAPNSVGLVYFAKSGSAPEVVKIGFSTNLERRMRDLKAETGEDHELEAWFVGTQLDEAIAHLTLSRRRMRGDWFFIGDEREKQIAGFVPFGAGRPRLADIHPVKEAAE